MYRVLTATALFTLTATAGAATIHVSSSGSIQSAINSASSGDVVLVSPGTYQELIDFQGKAITVRSSAGADSTTIDGSGLGGSVVTMDTSETPDSILDGFTITGGVGSVAGGYSYGGGVYLFIAEGTVRNCHFEGNTADAGGGLASTGGTSLIENCTFENNEATAGGNYGGGGIYLRLGSQTVRNCEFSNNEATGAAKGGGISLFQGGPEFINCLVSNNHAYFGGGIMNQKSWAAFTNCTVAQNTATSIGGGMWCIYSPAEANLTNTIFWGNTAGSEGDELLVQYGASTNVTYSNIRGGVAGEGNINANPMFANTDNEDCRLAAGSPCIDRASNSALPGGVAYDLDGNPRVYNSTVDMGAYESQEEGSSGPECAGDADGNGAIDFDDLLTMLTLWGDCPDCPSDVNGNGMVDFDDVLILLVAWGDCS